MLKVKVAMVKGSKPLEIDLYRVLRAAEAVPLMQLQGLAKDQQSFRVAQGVPCGRGLSKRLVYGMVDYANHFRLHNTRDMEQKAFIGYLRSFIAHIEKDLASGHEPKELNEYVKSFIEVLAGDLQDTCARLPVKYLLYPKLQERLRSDYDILRERFYYTLLELPRSLIMSCLHYSRHYDKAVHGEPIYSVFKAREEIEDISVVAQSIMALQQQQRQEEVEAGDDEEKAAPVTLDVAAQDDADYNPFDMPDDHDDTPFDMPARPGTPTLEQQEEAERQQGQALLGSSQGHQTIDFDLLSRSPSPSLEQQQEETVEDRGMLAQAAKRVGHFKDRRPTPVVVEQAEHDDPHRADTPGVRDMLKKV